MFEELIKTRLQSSGIPTDIDFKQYENLLDAFDWIVKQYSHRPAFTSLGRTITYKELDDYSSAFAAYLQNSLGLQVGDRIAIQLPNIIQFPIVAAAAYKAGLVVVNTNPLYTETELEHQFNDAGVKALVVLANVAHTAANVVANTSVESVIVTELADLHPTPKKQILNFAIKHIKKMVPKYDLPAAIKFTDALKQGQGQAFVRSKAKYDDVAILQYTGGTTGVAKGAMLSHGNFLSNILQCTPIFNSYGLSDKGDILIQPLPLYHIYAALVSFIVMFKGGHSVLIPNPRDLPGLVKELGKWKFQGFCGLNTLFVALCNNEDFKKLDFSHLKMTLSGGMALTRFAAGKWKEVTGVEIYEGYGLTETSPVVSVNSGKDNIVGTIGVPVPGTLVEIRDESGKSLAVGETGELYVKGPQVMKGYWQRPEATAESIVDGWFATGDIALMTEEGHLKIVDRKKDMILVSGFNVYPNEVEDVATQHVDILEAAAIGELDEVSGEVVHLYVVKTNPALTEADVIAHCRTALAAYKVPKKVFFKDELPKTNVGKVLRRQVRADAQAAKA